MMPQAKLVTLVVTLRKLARKASKARFRLVPVRLLLAWCSKAVYLSRLESVCYPDRESGDK